MQRLLWCMRLGRNVLLFLWPALLLLACGDSAAVVVEPSPTPTLSAVTAPGGDILSETPTRDQTIASQSDQLDLQTPDTPATVEPGDTPTFTPEPAPSNTTPASPTPGRITGQITFLHHTGEIRPDPNASVELVANTTSSYFSTQTNAAGQYTLANLPPGQYWLMARSPIGSSNPQEVQVSAGQTETIDLRTFNGYPVVNMRPAGGRVLIDGQPVSGATVWHFGGLLESDKRAVTDSTGYFSFLYVPDTLVIAASGDRWTVTTLQPDEVVNIELDRTGPHPTPPAGPVVTPVPVDDDIAVFVPTPPAILPTRLVPRIEVILPTRPAIGQPTRPSLAISPVAEPNLAQPALTPLPTTTPSPTSTFTPVPTPTPLPPTSTPTRQPIPTACGQSADKAAYGPIQVGSTVVLGRHATVQGTASWDKEMEQYLKQKTTVTGLAGVDKVGCPMVRVDIDGGRWLWRIRALTLLEQ